MGEESENSLGDSPVEGFNWLQSSCGLSDIIICTCMYMCIYIYAAGILVQNFELVKGTLVKGYLVKQNEKELNHDTI